MHRNAGGETSTKKGRPTEKQTGRQTDRQADRERQVETERYRDGLRQTGLERESQN